MAGSSRPALHLIPGLLLLAAFPWPSPIAAQERFVIQGVVVYDQDEAHSADDVTAMVTNAPTKGRVVLYEKGGVRIGAWVRTNTHHVSKGRPEPGTIGITIVLDLLAHGHREKREIGRTFMPDDERLWQVSEKFLARTALGNRKIVVTFTGRVE
jgi:hypothetical protein